MWRRSVFDTEEPWEAAIGFDERRAAPGHGASEKAPALGDTEAEVVKTKSLAEPQLPWSNYDRTGEMSALGHQQTSDRASSLSALCQMRTFGKQQSCPLIAVLELGQRKVRGAQSTLPTSLRRKSLSPRS